MNPFLARIGSLALGLVLLLQPRVALADGFESGMQGGPQLWFQGARLILADSQPEVGDLAVPSTDPGLISFLDRVGAHLSFQPGQRYVVLTTASRRQITFTIGESDINVDGINQSGPFKILRNGSGVLLPFYTIARVLDIAAVPSLGQVVLEPQITGLDAHEDHARSVVFLHAALPLHPRVVSSRPDEVSVQFHGIGTSLSSKRLYSAPGLRSVKILQTGTARSPVTTIVFRMAPQARAGVLRSFDPHGVVLAFAPPRVDLHAPLLVATLPSAEAIEGSTDDASFSQTLQDQSPKPTSTWQPHSLVTPRPTPYPEGPIDDSIAYDTLPLPLESPAASPPPPVVSQRSIAVEGLDERTSADAFTVRVALTGQPRYRWRVLADGRFFIDFPGAVMRTRSRDEAFRDPHVSSLRIRSNGAAIFPNVRLALGLLGNEAVRVTSDPVSLTVTVGGANAVLAARGGAGQVGGPDHPELVQRQPPQSQYLGGVNPLAPPMRLATGSGSRIIVLDPGHGGSDSGAVGNGLIEKNLTLDIARRLRTLLIARGWQVVMTRDNDVDVYAANDSAREELQARCDVANRLGARMFVSIHVNSFTSPEMQGTTTYYYKSGDALFARLVDQRLHTLLGTEDDGARKENFYVLRHTTMPSILVETAFLSNPSDAFRLNQPMFRQNIAVAISDGITLYTTDAPATVWPLGRTITDQRIRSDQPVDDLSP